MAEKAIITPIGFQEICDQAVIAVDSRGWPADALPYDLASAVITEIFKRVSRHLGEKYLGHPSHHTPPNEQRVEEIVEMVSQHWSGPILVERIINETVRMVLEHWREHHHPTRSNMANS